MLVKNEFKKLQKFDSSYFKGKSHFEEDGIQNYLVLQPAYKCFKTINSIDNISEWNSKRLSNENIETPNTSTNFLNPLLDYVSTKIRVKLSGSFLKQDKATYNHGTIVNIYIVYEISLMTLFILVLGKDFIQGIDNTTIYTEKLYSINFTENNKRFCLSLHYNEDNSYLFVNGKEIIKFKTKDSEIVAFPLCLGDISKDFSVNNMKKTGLNGYAYDFSVYCDAIAVDDILDIHKYLMKKNGI